ncbi:hypothetical protein OESDEN_00896 [Oesophagostomum dentatum]|uniref:VWFA domain-containing protein n=1 Tax=Oesophagostomum dentatum TaxID=61180 RepID=A0A0B1TNQ1_OESDE|nr:hypothetical protein OESDEN_00896 [Oesophagostomum dentatum]
MLLLPLVARSGGFDHYGVRDTRGHYAVAWCTQTATEELKDRRGPMHQICRGWLRIGGIRSQPTTEKPASKSSICFHATALPSTMLPQTSASTFTSITTSPSCSYSASKLEQDVAFVVEISTSTGNLDASNAAANFIKDYLIKESIFNDDYSNYAIVPFPNPSSYNTYTSNGQDFGKLTTSTIPVILRTMLMVAPSVGGSTSDIESGLSYAENSEFTLLKDSYPRTVLLFANSVDGVKSATATADELKAQNATILTVSVTNDASFNLDPLATSPIYNYNLPIADTSTYTGLAKGIATDLLKFGSICNQ